MTTSLNTSTSELLDCREDFFREEDSEICVPSCYTWKTLETITIDVLMLLSAIVGFIFGLVVLVIIIVHQVQKNVSNPMVMNIIFLDRNH